VKGRWPTAIPAGYEIYENPNSAGVLTRRIPPKIITDAERQVVEDGMRTSATVKDYKIDVKGNALLIYTAEAGILRPSLRSSAVHHPESVRKHRAHDHLTQHHAYYSPMLVFQLVEVTRRTFQTQTLLLPRVGG